MVEFSKSIQQIMMQYKWIIIINNNNQTQTILNEALAKYAINKIE